MADYGSTRAGPRSAPRLLDRSSIDLSFVVSGSEWVVFCYSYTCHVYACLFPVFMCSYSFFPSFLSYSSYWGGAFQCFAQSSTAYVFLTFQRCCCLACSSNLGAWERSGGVVWKCFGKLRSCIDLLWC